MLARHGPPKHQNKFAWNPNAGHKKNEKELGGKFRPFSEITGVCPRCKEQIEWKRRYGKYKPLVEPAKCQKCTKRAVRQAYHSLCSGCAKAFNVCAKCCCSRDQIVGRDASEVEAEKKALEEAIKNARERDRRTLLRAMNNGKAGGSSSRSLKIEDRSREGNVFPATSIDEYAELANESISDEDDDLICT
ncbi:hypothetical protein M5K25_002812 [Dendrobium thyrsiflorum]|uniref:Uncharacterized protein n=1 Tax=Dendrobium thyrsiflorum TaxID=117978 RepID=A0ABD0VPH2_DENTH